MKLKEIDDALFPPKIPLFCSRASVVNPWGRGECNELLAPISRVTKEMYLPGQGENSAEALN